MTGWRGWEGRWLVAFGLLAGCAGDPAGLEPPPLDAAGDAPARCQVTVSDDGQPPPRCSPTPWQIQQIDVRPGAMPTIAVTASGRPVISWSVDDQTYLVEPTTSGWAYESIAPITSLPTVAADADGNVHVVYIGLEGASRLLRYARRQPGGAWDDVELGMGDAYAVAADRCGTHVLLTEPHVDPADDSQPGRPVYAHRIDDGPWQRTPLDERGLTGSLALGPDGTPHALYLTGSVLRHAMVMDRWRHGNLATSKGVPHAALAVARDGAAHVVFTTIELGRVDGVLMHGRLGPGGAWEFEPVPSGYDPLNASLVLDRDGRPRVTSLSFGSYRSSLSWFDERGSWNSELIPIGLVHFPRLAIDDSGGLHIAANGDDGLFYGYRCLETP